MSSIYILRYDDAQFSSNLHIFSNVDSALDHMKLLLEDDIDLCHYTITKYSLDSDSQQYLFDHDFNLDELIQIDECEESDGLSYLDSEDEPTYDSP